MHAPDKMPDRSDSQRHIEAFGLRVRVRLFGSRVDDNAKGGDIDLLIECPEPIENAGASASRLAAKIRTAHGGDIDLLLELPEPVDNPALLAARMSAQVSHLLDGHSVDVLVSALNLMRLPIHDVAFKEGQLMTLDRAITQRLQFLAIVIRKEFQHLDTTDQGMFSNNFTLEQAARLVTAVTLLALLLTSEVSARSQPWVMSWRVY